MDSLQYVSLKWLYLNITQKCFKPYYNWNTFNTEGDLCVMITDSLGFKPYYNWNTFNTNAAVSDIENDLGF